MKYFGQQQGEMHKQLSCIIHKPERIEEAKQLFLDMHALLHMGAVTHTSKNEIDQLLSDLKTEEYAIMPTKKDETIAWVLWHTARIEDLTMGILVGQGQQIFNEEWQKKMNVRIKDTGNALNDDEIMEFSHQVDIPTLITYRNEVGKRTQQIVRQLQAEDMHRAVSLEGIRQIKETGGVTSQEDSLWLLDYWGNKDVAGLLLMPPSRHLIMHFNACVKWKQQIRTRTQFFRQ